MPKLSVCIPAYNQAALLKKAIDSVLRQNYTDYEIIITDDSPGNIVAELVATYNADHRIRYFKNPSQFGSPKNWNECIKKASGQYIKILHHDDYLNNDDSLSKFIHLLDQDPNIDFAFSASHAISEDHDRIHVIAREQVNLIMQNPLILYSGNIIGGPSATIVRRNSPLFYDEQLKWLVDIEYYIRQITANRNIGYTSEALVATFAAKGRITDHCKDNREIEIYEHFYLLEKIYKSQAQYTYDALKNCIIYAINLCKKYNIKSVQDLQHCGYYGGINIKIKLYLAINALSKISGRLYFKLLRSI